MGSESAMRDPATAFSPGFWEDVTELLGTGEYERAASRLHIARSISASEENHAMAAILAAAHDICVACGQQSATVAEYREAEAAAARRERLMREQLFSLLAHVTGQDAFLAAESAAATAGAEANDAHSSHHRGQIPRLISKVKALLGRRTDSEDEPAIDPPAIDDPAGRLPAPSPSKEKPAVAPLESTVPRVAAEGESGPSLAIYCLGAFRLYDNGQMIDEWTGNKSRSILKYMVLHRDQPVHRDRLIDLFWREDEPDAARRNLYQAIYLLRQALQASQPDFQYILCDNSCYLFNPELDLWVDFENFLTHYQGGQRLEREGRLKAAIREYETAENYYEGPLLPEDLYEEWTLVMRERLKNAYLDALDRVSRYYWAERQFALCVAYCQKILVADNCREDAHRRLMLAHMQQGHRHLALRQYHRCVEALRQELDTEPMPETLELYQKIKRNQL